MVQDFLPAMRQLVAKELRAQGFSQSKTAALLGTTQASVSIYLSSKTDKAYSHLSKLSVAPEDATRYSRLLADRVQTGAEEGVDALARIWKSLLASGAACPAHRALYPSLASCDFCISEYSTASKAGQEAVVEVSDAVKLLEASPTFAQVIPEVSANIACLSGDADSPADVVAVPGRIAKVKGRAKALLPPEAGASTHLSRMLLLVRKRRKSVRACINLKFDRKMARTLSASGLRVLRLSGQGAGAGVDPTLMALESRLRHATPTFEAVVDSGGGGREPSTYLFADGAREVAQLAVDVSKRYSSG